MVDALIFIVEATVGYSLFLLLMWAIAGASIWVLDRVTR